MFFSFALQITNETTGEKNLAPLAKKSSLLELLSEEFLHFMSMKRMSIISKVCLGNGLGAGERTFNTCVCVST